MTARILVVDDILANVRLLEAKLSAEYFEVVTAMNGVDALEAVQRAKPDIVLLDVMMPEMDGFETCRELRVLPGFESLPVLMLTGLDDDASITRAYEAGATDFFVKSTQWSLLSGRLRYLLRSSRTRQELERSKSKLARAQDLARMGSFDWRSAQGVLVLSSPLFGGNPQLLADLALRRHVPTISLFPDIAREGGLLAYGPDIQGLYRQAGAMGRKVLQGAKPADLPAERPVRFQLIANLKTAKKLGLELPSMLLARADEVIE